MIPLDEYGNVIEDVVEARELEFGHEGDDVSELQQRLTDLHYYTGNISGRFREGTRAAIREFQEDFGLEVTGVADNETQVLLYSDDAPMTAEARITPSPEPTEEPLQPAEVSNAPIEDGQN